MSRLIDADALIKNYIVDEAKDDSEVISRADIDNAPTVDAEPIRHGEWEEIEIQLTWCEDDVDIIYKCSVCRENNIGRTNYCPNCGAKMDERNENEPLN